MRTDLKVSQTVDVAYPSHVLSSPQMAYDLLKFYLCSNSRGKPKKRVEVFSTNDTGCTETPPKPDVSVQCNKWLSANYMPSTMDPRSSGLLVGSVGSPWSC